MEALLELEVQYEQEAVQAPTWWPGRQQQTWERENFHLLKGEEGGDWLDVET